VSKKKTARARQDEWILRLYVAGRSVRSTAALRNLEAICEELDCKPGDILDYEPNGN